MAGRFRFRLAPYQEGPLRGHPIQWAFGSVPCETRPALLHQDQRDGRRASGSLRAPIAASSPRAGKLVARACRHQALRERPSMQPNDAVPPWRSFAGLYRQELPASLPAAKATAGRELDFHRPAAFPEDARSRHPCPHNWDCRGISYRLRAGGPAPGRAVVNHSGGSTMPA